MKFSDGGTQAKLRALQNGYDPAVVLNVIGRRLVNTEIPLVFRNHAGWHIPLRGGQPGSDRGILQKSFVWRLEGNRKLIVGTAHPGANTLNAGAPPVTIRPKRGKWLTIPFGPNLSTSERQTFNLRRFPGVFFIPKNNRLYAISRDKGGKSRLVAVLVKGIGGEGEPEIKKLEFLSWRLYASPALDAAGRYLRRLSD